MFLASFSNDDKKYLQIAEPELTAFLDGLVPYFLLVPGKSLCLIRNRVSKHRSPSLRKHDGGLPNDRLPARKFDDHHADVEDIEYCRQAVDRVYFMISASPPGI